MYEKYWKLNKKPFANEFSADFFYSSGDHKECLVRMVYAVKENKTLVVLTGPSGAGKTFLLNNLSHKLISQRFPVSLVTNPINGSNLDLLGQISDGFRKGSTPGSKREILTALQTRAREARSRNKHLVVLLDEADTLSEAGVFNELRLLTNLQVNGTPALTLVLAGNQQLKEMLAGHPRLAHRVDLIASLHGMEESDTISYVQHRLEAAGGSRSIFEIAALRLIHKFSQGNPRVVNNICDLALLMGCGQNRRKIDVRTVREATEEIRRTRIVRHADLISRIRERDGGREQSAAPVAAAAPAPAPAPAPAAAPAPRATRPASSRPAPKRDEPAAAPRPERTRGRGRDRDRDRGDRDRDRGDRDRDRGDRDRSRHDGEDAGRGRGRRGRDRDRGERGEGRTRGRRGRGRSRAPVALDEPVEPISRSLVEGLESIEDVIRGLKSTTGGKKDSDGGGEAPKYFEHSDAGNEGGSGGGRSRRGRGRRKSERKPRSGRKQVEAKAEVKAPAKDEKPKAAPKPAPKADEPKPTKVSEDTFDFDDFSLGILEPEEAKEPAKAEEKAEAEEKKPKTRKKTAKKKDDDAEEAPKPKAKRTRTRKAKKKDDDADGAEEAPKAKAKRKSRAKAKADDGEGKAKRKARAKKKTAAAKSKKKKSAPKKKAKAKAEAGKS